MFRIDSSEGLSWVRCSNDAVKKLNLPNFAPVIFMLTLMNMFCRYWNSWPLIYLTEVWLHWGLRAFKEFLLPHSRKKMRSASSFSLLGWAKYLNKIILPSLVVHTGWNLLYPCEKSQKSHVLQAWHMRMEAIITRGKCWMLPQWGQSLVPRTTR